MSYENDVAIKVEGISKCFQVYSHPKDRLKQFILPKAQTLLSKEKKKYYEEFWAVKDVSFDVKKGESVGILGRNGSGKSTLLQMICGTLSPTSGKVTTRGRIAALLELGSGFNPEFTGRENVYMNGMLLGLTREEIDYKYEDIISFADIGDFINQPVKTYSSGMLIRLAFAVQVQVEPDILVIDEALAVGDALFQKRCFQRIEQLTSIGTTLLFVSHDQESIRTLTNRALLLQNGLPLSWGKSSDVILDYRKLLHNDEMKYFSSITDKLKKNNLIGATSVTSQGETEKLTLNIENNTNDSNRSNSLSFGDGVVKIKSVDIINASTGEPCALFYPGDLIEIKIKCHVIADIEKLNVGIRIRNKEGIKIYSWGTLNQDMAMIHAKHGSTDDTFWSLNHKKDDEFIVSLRFNSSLGINLYEVQASVSYEDTPDYMAQRLLHWIDEAAFFQVSMKREEHFFGGVSDLQMKAVWYN
ncbi:ABC transporter ATP-binding protein [Aeromonas caviae]|uniref:ABC transporter ATP-binding protein n=1 Tax=Aeromonas caviae TaxID=648 RepID=UPI0038CF6FB2